MANLNFSGSDVTTGQYKVFLPGTDTLNSLSTVSSSTTTDSFLFSNVSQTSGSFLRGIIPSSGFTGRIIDVRDNAGSPVDKFVVDATGKIVTGSADAAFITSGTLTVARGGTALGSFTSQKIMYASSTNTFGELTADSTTMLISSGTLSVVADSVVEKVRVSLAGSLVGTRREVNFIQGSNTTLTVTDNSGSNRVDVTIAATGSTGSVWSALTDPSTNLSLAMASNTSTFTWGATTSTANLFTIQDTTSNTGTGYLFTVATGSSSQAKPFRATASGTSNGVAMDNTGNLSAIGTGVLNANALNGVAGNGLMTRTSAGTFTARTLSTASSGRITVTNGDGVSGNPTVDLASGIVSASTYTKLTVDTYGRVTAGTTISSSDVTTALTYTPLNKAGDTMSAGDLTLFQDPTSALHATTKQYVDAVAAGLRDYKESVRAASTGNITKSGTQTIDGVSLISGDRVLLKNQTTGSENGIWVVSAGSWSRSTDADTNAEVNSGMYVWVEEGTTNINSAWVLSTANPITLNTTSLTFVQVSGLGQITAGNGLTKTGNTLDVVTANSGRIVVAADSIDLASGIATTGTFHEVTIDTYGRVTLGANPTTLAGYGITDAQASDGDLTAIAAISSTGILARTASNTWAVRTLTGTSNRVVITNGDGVSGAPTFDIGTDVVTLTGSQVLTNKTLTSPLINFGSDANGDLITRAGGVNSRLAIGNQGTALISTGTAPSWGLCECVLSTTTSIDAKSATTTTLFTVPSGRTALITRAIVVVTAATSITQGPTAGVGIAAGEDDIFFPTQMTALTSTSKVFTFTAIGTYASAAATNVIKLGIDTAAAGTSMTLTVYLMGVLI